ncbi:MAG: sigma-70 family RNA polymerase sigma factor [Planctomycetes bacterium]|nr:sigma-70 family RNA polymerase sigma factor [Planctomycetota bacterium]
MTKTMSIERQDASQEVELVNESEARRVRSPEEIAYERDLIQRSQAGDRDAFEEIVRTYEKKVFWIAYNLVGHVEDARDIAQDSFLRVHKALGRFDLRFNFYTWLYRIVVNLSIDRLRKRGKQNSVSIEEFPTDPATDYDAEAALRNTELGDQIRQVLDDMPDKYRAVILLRDVEQLGCEEISEIIGCTNATTRWRLHKAREMFREKWGRVDV